MLQHCVGYLCIARSHLTHPFLKLSPALKLLGTTLAGSKPVLFTPACCATGEWRQ
jgi:hypothetical protein